LLKDLFKFTFNYSITNILAKLTNFLFLPLFTYFLPAEDYGIYSLITVFTILITIFVDSGTQFYLQSKSINNDLNVIIDKSINFISINAFASFIIFVLLTPIFSKLIFSSTNISVIIIISLLGMLFESTANYAALILKTTQQLKQLYITSILSFILQIVLLPFFLVFLKLGYISIFLTQIIVNVILLVYLQKTIQFNFNFRIDYKEYKNFIIFVFPILLTNLLTIGIDLIDRYILNFYVTISEIGIYSFAYKFANIIKIIAYSFLPAWISIIIKEKNNKNYKHLVSKNFYKVTFIFLILAFIFYILTKIFFHFGVFNKSYQTNDIVYLTLNLSYALYGIINFLYFYPYSIENPKIILYSDIIGFTTNIIFNLILIPIYGIEGAALSTFISFLLACIYLINVVSNKFHNFIDFNKIILIITIFVSCSVILFLYTSIIVTILVFLTLLFFLFFIYYSS